MKRKGALGLLGILVAIAAVAAIGVVAYNIGVNNGHDGHVIGGPMMRGFRGGMFGMDGGGWWWGIVPALLLVFVVVLVFAALAGGSSRNTQPSVPWTPAGPATPATPVESPAGLREIVEMHDRGALTDEEFAAAKRKFLGL